MTEPTDQEVEALVLPPGGNYASDRHLLLQEIKSLAKEVARLRGDTKYLNEVTVPREEHRRRRKVNSILAGLSVLLFSVAAAGLYVQSQDLNRTQEQVQQASFNECESDKAAAEAMGPAVVAINDLLNSLRDARQSLVDNPEASPAGREVATKEVEAYERYLAFVQERVASQPQQDFDCSQYLDR